MNRIKSPDEALLYMAALAMRIAYNGLGVSPLVVHLAHVFLIAISGLGFLFIGATADAQYILPAGINGYWAWSFWRDARSLRQDVKAEWSLDLYKKYGAKAVFLTEQTSLIRYLLVALALVSTMTTFSDMVVELKDLELWQKCFVPLSFWAVVIFVYAHSAEVPPPDDGDLVLNAKPT